MYIDPIVDRIHPRAKEVLGFVPIDEPLLSEVFDRKKFVMVEEFGAKLILPKPEVLLATKLNSVSNRGKEHKRLKDIADIYALLLYSYAELSDLKREASAIVGQERTTEVASAFTAEDYAAVSQNLGVTVTEVSMTIAQLKSRYPFSSSFSNYAFHFPNFTGPEEVILRAPVPSRVTQESTVERPSRL
jgi:hypothetical protein